MKNPDMNFKKYIGRTYDESNCFDIVKEFYRDFFNVELKDYYEGNTPSSEELDILIKASKGEFKEVPIKDGKLGDIMIIELYGIECHVGVFIDKQHFIHSTKTNGSTLEKIKRYENKITGLYRLRNVA